mmetsp:Transcript_4498/g.6955  ORF Transcript_4498/g.6955 Transcript_4498/m.6955 type:complete len:103 (-) Transcript_4498:1101-1409(-)
MLTSEHAQMSSVLVLLTAFPKLSTSTSCNVALPFLRISLADSQSLCPGGDETQGGTNTETGSLAARAPPSPKIVLRSPESGGRTHLERGHSDQFLKGTPPVT